MSLLDLLRTAIDARLEIHGEAGALSVMRRPDRALTASLRAELAANKAALLRALDCHTLGEVIGLGDPVPASAALVVAWLLAEREGFSIAESEQRAERAARRDDGALPLWLAELTAIEDVLAARKGQLGTGQGRITEPESGIVGGPPASPGRGRR